MSKKRQASSVNDLRPVEQTMVLETLAARNDAVGEAVREEIERLLAAVDPESIAGEVQVDLELIDTDTIEDRSGTDRYGYTAPDEAAWEVLEEALASYLERMKWYHSAGRDGACDAYAFGVLRGLFVFHHESEAEWTELAPDDVREMFGSVLREWRRLRKGTAELDAMRDQLAIWCPGWERDVT